MKYRVLVLEDEPALRRALERALISFGYEVATSGDPTSAYVMLAEHHFDALLVDLRLPGTLGDAFYYAVVRQWPSLRGRVILMSGDPWTGTEDWPQELRDCPMLAKPFTLDLLARTLGSLLEPYDRLRTNGL